MTIKRKNIDKNILKTVTKTIFECQMLRKNDTVLVGVSGGPDSIALLNILMELKSELAITVHVAHLNHGIRGKESDEDAEFVLKTADHLGLECHIEKINVPEFRKKHKLSLEHAARRVRYSFFDRLMARYHYDKIALGHHLDDNAEMILMALFRGSGPLGLSGIPPVREGRIIRPLIRVTRADINAYLSARGIRYVIDASNADAHHLRNKIRQGLLPMLKADYNPSIAASLTRMAGILRSEEDWINQTIEPFFQSAVLKSEKNSIILSAVTLLKFHPAVIRRLIRMALEHIKGDLKKITFRHVSAIVELLNSTHEKEDWTCLGG